MSTTQKTHSKKISPKICVILCIFAANFSGVSPGWMVVIVTNDLARNGCHSDEAAHVYVSVERVEQTGASLLRFCPNVPMLGPSEYLPLCIKLQSPNLVVFEVVGNTWL